MKETFLPVDGWPKYEIGSAGTLLHLGEVVVGSVNSWGYKSHCLYRPYRETWSVEAHILVALAFIGKRPGPAHQVNHINGKKLDNRWSNLEWKTPQGNMEHAWKTGLRKRKLSDEQIRAIRASGEAQCILADRLGVDPSQVSRIRARKAYAWVE